MIASANIGYSRSIKTVTASFSLALASYPSVKYIMESELVKESVVLGHHIYKDVWSPVVGELLPVLQESNNVHDRRAVAVFSDVNIVGHVPRELSRIFWFFLDKYTPID